MLRATPLRKRWCPGARRPMQAKDGLLVRLRIRGSRITSAVLRALAQAGCDHGNGIFDLSTRGNLQIRGVRESCLPELTRILESLGLIDETAAAEAVRNIMLSPLAGLDGRNEATKAAQTLEAMLATETDLHALPGKFTFLIDDGSALSLGSVPSDIRFDWIGGKQMFAIGIGGFANETIDLGHCEGIDVPTAAARLARAFLRLGALLQEPPRRMRSLIEQFGANAIAAEAGLHLSERQRQSAIEEPCPIGPMRFHDKYCFGAGAAFGHFDADMLNATARAADDFGTGEIRLTPWRALILPNISEANTRALQAYLAAHRFIVDRSDIRLAIAACGGITTCEHGTTDTRRDALALMAPARQLFRAGTVLHVSGCAKGCARPTPASLTLIGRDGLYDLITGQAARDAGINDAGRLDVGAVRTLLKVIS